jgi:hypothetical protein
MAIRMGIKIVDLLKTEFSRLKKPSPTSEPTSVPTRPDPGVLVNDIEIDRV